MSKKQMGFTLIEIVMVLVLLGILSAVAVPKYFDLRAQAEQKAMDAVAAEVQAQINGTFAQKILDSSNSCDTAVSAAMGIVGAKDTTAVKITDDAYTVAWEEGKDNDGASGTRKLTVTAAKNTGNKKTYTLGIPVCTTPKAN